MKKISFSKDQLREMKNMYVSGLPCSKIASIFNCHESTIKNNLKKEQVPFRSNGESHKKYKVNEIYFEKIDSFDKAYFLGLLVADGHANKKGFEISLQIEDKKIIELFKTTIDYTGNLKIKKDNRKESYKDTIRLTVSRQKIAIDLKKYGVCQGKSYNAYFPDIPEEFHNHFIRGVFDGDGCIMHIKNKRNIFDICGNNTLLIKIQEILIKNCEIYKKNLNYPDKNKNFCHLVVGKKAEIEKIREYLYKDCDNFYIDRKYQKMFNLM